MSRTTESSAIRLEAENMTSCFYRHKAGENIGMSIEYRIERDPMGEVRVPAGALYGPQTQRAVDNFPISGLRFPRSFIRALGLIKAAAAKVNGEAAVEAAANEVMEGIHDSQFVLDIFQTGSE